MDQRIFICLMALSALIIAYYTGYRKGRVDMHHEIVEIELEVGNILPKRVLDLTSPRSK